MLFGRWLHARGRGHCRGKPVRAQHAQAYGGKLYRASKRKICEGGGQLDRRRARGVLKPCMADSLCHRTIFSSVARTIR